VESRPSLGWAAPARIAEAEVRAIVPSFFRSGLGTAGDTLGVVPGADERGDHAGVELPLVLELGLGCAVAAGRAARRPMVYGKMDLRLPVLLLEALKCAVICWLWCSACSSRSSSRRWPALWERRKIVGAALVGKRLSWA
jgi:hypothetical protein